MKKIPLLLISISMLLGACAVVEPKSSISSSSSFSIDSQEPSSESEDVSSINTSLSKEEEFDPLKATDLTKDGISFKENKFLITKSGSYTFSSDFEFAGQIEIDSEYDVNVILNGFGITSNDPSVFPIFVNKANSFTLSIAAGTSNYINYGAPAIDNEKNLEASKGAIYSNSSMSIIGRGELVIHSSLYGIESHGYLTFDGPNIRIMSEDVGVIAWGNIDIFRSTFNVESGSYGIKTIQNNSNSDIKTKNSDIFIKSGDNCIDSARNIEVDGGKIQLDSTSLENGKGINAKSNLIINSGDIDINAQDDGLHAKKGVKLFDGTSSDGDITINGGNIKIKSLNNGIQADRYLTINDGNIDIQESLEGIEANQIKINGGFTRCFATDDGINASDKAGLPIKIIVTGGILDSTVFGKNVDAIDSNGTFEQSGGLVLTKGGNNTKSTGLEADDGAFISGGTLIVFGPHQAEVTPSGIVQNKKLESTYEIGTYLVEAGSDKVETETLYGYSEINVYSVDNNVSIIKK